MEDERNGETSQGKPEQSRAARWLCCCKGILSKKKQIIKTELHITGSAETEEETSSVTGASGAAANVEEES